MAEPPGGHCEPAQAHGGPLLHHPHPAGTNEGRVWLDRRHQNWRQMIIVFCLIESPRLFLPSCFPPITVLKLFHYFCLLSLCTASVNIFLFSVPVLYVPTSSSTCYTSCCFFSSEAKQLTLQCHLATSHYSNCPAVCNNSYYIALNLH